MISNAKAIPHGHAHLEYIKDESPNKNKRASRMQSRACSSYAEAQPLEGVAKHKDKILHVCENLMPKYISGAAIWEEICDITADRPRMKNNLIRIVVSPSEEHTRDFTIADWQQLWLDFAREFDNIELCDEKTGDIYSSRTNILGSMYTVELHLESDSGVPHIHAAVCRIDKDGHTNNDHDIHLRAQRAAEIVAMKRGWKTAAKISEENTEQIRRDCYDILANMPRWDLQTYLMRLFERGYDVQLTKDKRGIPHGYTIKLGKNCYRASKIDRKLTLRYIEQTWAKLHQQRQSPPLPVRHKPVSESNYAISKQILGFKRYICPHPGYSSHHFSEVFVWQNVFVPEVALEVFDKEFDPRFIANADQLKDYAIALFVMLIGGGEIAPVSMGGGGSDNDRDWGRKGDEDDRQWAIRCAQRAAALIGVKSTHRRPRR